MTAPGLAVALAVLGGGALIVGGISILCVDRRIQVADPGTARPIYFRYVSLATQSLHEWPHWMFVIVMTVAAPCIVAVGHWMAAIGRDVEPQGDKSYLDQIETQGLITGLVGPILAASPMGNSLGTLVHIAAAVAFLVAGMGWASDVLYVKHLWLLFARDEDSTWQTPMSRTVTTLSYIGIGFIAVSFYYAMVGTQLLAKYQYNSERNPLTPAQIMRYRIAEAGLAVGEICQALVIGASLLACIPVLADLTKEQMKESDAGLYGGIVAAYAVGVVIFFWATNSFFIKKCQTYSYDDDDGDDGDDGPSNGDADNDVDKNGVGISETLDAPSPDDDDFEEDAEKGKAKGSENTSLSVTGTDAP